MGEGAAHIIILAAARFDELLKFRNYFVKAPVAFVVNAESVVNLFAPVKA